MTTRYRYGDVFLLGHKRLKVLGLIYSGLDLSQTEIANECGMSITSLATMLVSLMDHGMVCRHPRDARKFVPTCRFIPAEAL